MERLSFHLYDIELKDLLSSGRVKGARELILYNI